MPQSLAAYREKLLAKGGKFTPVNIFKENCKRTLYKIVQSLTKKLYKQRLTREQYNKLVEATTKQVSDLPIYYALHMLCFGSNILPFHDLPGLVTAPTFVQSECCMVRAYVGCISRRL